MSILIGCGSDKGDVFCIEYNHKLSKYVDKFIDPESHSLVTAVAIQSNCMVSADVDGSLHSYYFKDTVMPRMLSNAHDKKVTSVNLSADGKFLLTTDIDGLFLIWRQNCDKWENVKQMADLKPCSSITSVCLHPSEKLALSLGKDCILRVWNLYKGQQYHTVKMKKSYLSVKFSKTGNFYALVGVNFVDLFQFDGAEFIGNLKCSKMMKDVEFYGDDFVCIAETSSIYFYALPECKSLVATIDLNLFKCYNLTYLESDNDKLLFVSCTNQKGSCLRIYSTINGDVTSLNVAASYELPNVRLSAVAAVVK